MTGGSGAILRMTGGSGAVLRDTVVKRASCGVLGENHSEQTMEHAPGFDEPEFGASTGDARENDPSLPGFTAHDPLFRSHFQHANRHADRAYEDVRPAYRLGFGAAGNSRFAGKTFEDAEKDLEGDWLNVRV